MKIAASIFKTLFLCLCIIANTHLAYAQTASILPQGKTQFLDNNGKPLTSGTVDFYIPSTTTRKTTWQNSAETVANSNPVVLDAGGRAIIYGDGSYRQVVKDRLGNVIWDQVTSSTGSGSGSSTATGDGDLVGTIKPWAGMTAPNQYVFTYGQEISRTTYSALFTAITSSQSVFCTSGSPTLTGLSDTTNFWVGASVEVSCLAAGFSTIISKTSSSITLASNANVSTNVTAIIFPWGRGNGTTTFNVPDLRGFAIAGNNNMGGVASSTLNTTYFGATDPNSVGAAGGSQSTTLVKGNMGSITPSGTITNGAITNGAITFPNSNGSADAAGLSSNAVVTSASVSGGVSLTVALNPNQAATTQATSTFTGLPVGGGIAVSATLGVTGSGYTNGSQTITVSGGTCTTQPQFTVTVAGNVFTGTPALLTAGSCTVAPNNPAATTGGGGTGGTLNVIYSAQPISLIQPTKTSNYIIKITPDTNSATASGVTSLGGMTGDIACGTGLLCTGNNISVASTAGINTYDVTKFGAVCNGVTDDATAIASAITLLSVTGGKLVFPNATCVSSTVQTINVPVDKAVSVVGGGAGVTKVLFTSAIANGFVVFQGSQYGGVHFEGLSVITNKANSGAAIALINSVALGFPVNNSLTDVVVSGDVAAGPHYWTSGIVATNVSFIALSSVNVYGSSSFSGTTCFTFQGTAASSINAIIANIDQSNFVYCGVGVYYGDWAQGLTIAHTNFQNGVTGVYTSNVTSGGTADQLVVSNSQFGGLSGSAVQTRGIAAAIAISNNLMFTADGTTSISLEDTTSQFTIQGNTIAGAGSGSTSKGVSVNGVIGIITGNVIENQGTGVTLGATSANVTVIQSSNKFYNNGTNINNLGATTNITTVQPNSGGLGLDASASTGVPLFTAGTAAITATTGTSDFVRKLNPVFPNTSNLYWRNAANSADYSVVVLDSSNNLQIGSTIPGGSGIFLGGAGIYPLTGTQDIGSSGSVWRDLNHKNSIFYGATSGKLTVKSAAIAGSNTLTLPAGTTDFSATGGTSQVVKQTSAGGALTVARLACSDLSDATAACSNSVAAENARLSSGTINVTVTGVDFSTVSEKLITVPLPSGVTRWAFQQGRIYNASTSLAGAFVQLWSGSGGTGTAMLGSTAVTVTSSSANTAANMQAGVISAATIYWNFASFYIRVSTGIGSPATADFTVTISPLN